MTQIAGIAEPRLRAFVAREAQRYAESRPRTRAADVTISV